MKFEKGIEELFVKYRCLPCDPAVIDQEVAFALTLTSLTVRKSQSSSLTQAKCKVCL